jgi:hypothetical protein
MIPGITVLICASMVFVCLSFRAMMSALIPTAMILLPRRAIAYARMADLCMVSRRALVMMRSADNILGCFFDKMPTCKYFGQASHYESR